jgi:DNA-binding NarL/FixJ family response regulator
LESEKTRILLADDHGLVRGGLRLILDGEPDLVVVAEASDGAEAVELSSRGDIDLAILDIAMPRMTGLQAAREMSRRAPAVRILMLSMYDNEQYFFEALKAGASGYVLKSVADRDLVEACRAAMRGEPFLYAGAVTALIRDPRSPTASSPPARRRSSSSSPKGTPPSRSPTHWSSAPRPSTGTGQTSSRSSECTTAST